MKYTTIKPTVFYKWIKEVLDDFYKNSDSIDLDLDTKIIDIFEPLGWELYDWLLFLTTIEIKFNIDIPDEWGADQNLTIGELVTNLATIKVHKDKSLGFRKVMALGWKDICD